MHIIPEEAGEDEEEDEDDEGTTGSSDSNENSDEDIDNLLAPQEQSQKNEWVPFFVFLLGGKKENLEIHVSSFISHFFREKNVKADEKVKGKKSLQ